MHYLFTIYLVNVMLIYKTIFRGLKLQKKSQILLQNMCIHHTFYSSILEFYNTSPQTWLFGFQVTENETSSEDEQSKMSIIWGTEHGKKRERK